MGQWISIWAAQRSLSQCNYWGYWASVHIHFVHQFYFLMSILRISAVPPFPGLCHFPDGHDFYSMDRWRLQSSHEGVSHCHCWRRTFRDGQMPLSFSGLLLHCPLECSHLKQSQGSQRCPHLSPSLGSLCGHCWCEKRPHLPTLTTLLNALFLFHITV